ncbi:MAG: hypothetical protein WCG80_11645 [Spirochaetales bacterium]
MKSLLATAWLALLLASPLGSQTKALDYDQVRSDEAVHEGVVAFHNGQYSRAVLAFEKALVSKPEAATARSWLGEALYASGLVEQALNEWKHVLQTGVKNELLTAWVDVLDARRSLDRETQGPDRYLPLYELSGKAKDVQGKTLFLRPSALRTLPDGGYLIAGFGTEEVIQIDAGGNLVKRLVAGVGGLQAPFDVLVLDDKYYVSEFLTDQISILDSTGLKTKSFGGKGRAEGKFLGPQFLASDGSALYVSDWGNSRVQKFDREGNFLLSFGAPAVGFAGLKNPTGLAATESTVYVADKSLKSVLAFDPNGNWLATYAAGRLEAPESLQLLTDGRLLVSDETRVQFLDPASDTLVPFDPDWNQGLKVTSSAIDANHNLVLADFDDNKIRVLTEGQTIYSGLVVRIVRLNTKAYPEISVDFTVEDRWGRPVTGLKVGNFVLSESGKRLVTPTLAFQGYRSNESETALVIDRDPAMAREEAGIREATGFFTQTFADRGGVWLYAAGNNPLPQNQRLSGVSENQNAAVNPATLTTTGQFDLAVLQAASSMIPSLKRRTVVYVTGGTVAAKGFARFNLTETAAFLRNNGIVFDVASVNDAPLAAELSYLMEATGGRAWSVKKDLRPFEASVNERVSGLYSLKYTAITPPEAGTRSIPVTVEVQNFKQSGRAQLTYFGPQ